MTYYKMNEINDLTKYQTKAIWKLGSFEIHTGSRWNGESHGDVLYSMALTFPHE